MTQPPLTRAMRSLEHELGAPLLDRSPKGVGPTQAGLVLYEEASLLLERADQLRLRVSRAAEPGAITIGVLADIVEHVNVASLNGFRRAHPSAVIRIHEADLTDPSAGLRSRLADVALTRGPLDEPGIQSFVLGTEPMGVVVRKDDPVACEPVTSVAALTDRDWVRLPDSAGAAWNGYWSGVTNNRHRSRAMSRTIQECLQSVLWDGATALAPLHQPLPEGLTIIPVDDRQPNRLLVAWRRDAINPLVRSFLRTVAASRN